MFSCPGDLSCMPTHRIYAIASSERWHAASAPAPLPGAMRSAACGSIRCASESAGGHVIKFRQATLDALEPFKWDGGACCQTTKLKATLKKSPLLLQPG